MRRERNIYLVDYGTVKANGLNGLFELHSLDKVIIFMHESERLELPHPHDKFSITCHIEIEICKTSIERERDLDYQLMSRLGFEVRYNRMRKNIFIISNNSSFTSILGYWAPKYPHDPIFKLISINSSFQLGIVEPFTAEKAAEARGRRRRRMENLNVLLESK